MPSFLLVDEVTYILCRLFIVLGVLTLALSKGQFQGIPGANQPEPERVAVDRYAFFFWFIYVPILQNNPGPVSVRELHRYISHVAKVKPASVLVYKKYIGFRSDKSEAELKNLEKGRDGQYNGYMSPATTRNVRTLLENWLQAIECELTDNWQIPTTSALADSTNHRGTFPTFVTLTLPARQDHDDNFIKRNLLNRFLITLKLQHKVEHYFWRAEPQRNGNIHFHILADRWVHWRAIRHIWNRILDEYGYIDRYRQTQQRRHRDGYTPDGNSIASRVDRMHEQAKAAHWTFDPKAARRKAQAADRRAYDNGLKNNWSDPNSTDIHAIEKVHNLTAYVVKYIAKKSDCEAVTVKDSDGNVITGRPERAIKGRIWGCSDGIRDLKHFEQEVAQEIDYQSFTHNSQAYELVRHLEQEAAARAALDPTDDSVWRDTDSGTVVYRLDQKSHALLKSLFPTLFAEYALHYRQHYRQLYGENPITDQAIRHLSDTITAAGAWPDPPFYPTPVSYDHPFAPPEPVLADFAPTDFCPF